MNHLRNDCIIDRLSRMADTMAVRARDTYVPANAVAEFYMKAGERENFPIATK